MSGAAESSFVTADAADRRRRLVLALADGRSAADLADELKVESDQQLHVDPDQALRVAELIAELADLAHDSRVRALGCLAVADALRLLGRYSEALAAYASAAALYRESEDEVGWARTRIGAAVTWRYTGIATDSLAEIDRARLILGTRALWVRLARLEQHAGILLCELGRLEEATQCYERALDAARRIEVRDPPQEARILGNLALACQRLGDYERAESLHAAALAVFAEHGQAQELALARANSAQLLADQGHYSRGLEMTTSARRSFQLLGRTIDAAFVGRAATHCLLALNRFDEAVALAAEVVAEFDSAGAAIELAATLLLHSAGLRRLGRNVEALADLDRAYAQFLISDCRAWVAIVRGERAAVLADARAWEPAAAEATAAAAELFERGQVVDGARATLVRANALRAMGVTAEAQTAVDQVLVIVQGRGTPWLEYQARRLAGELAQQLGHSVEALAAFKAAIDALEQVQGRILTEARSSFLADKLDVYEAAVGLCLDLGQQSAAFEFVERAKSRALVDALAGKLDIRIRPRTTAEEGLSAELTRLRRRHEQLSAVTTGVLASGTEYGPTPPSFPGEELAACETQIAVLLDELRLGQVADLERVSLLQGRVYPLELDERTRLVEYFNLGADDLCVFVGSPGADVAGWRLSGARRRVERLVARLNLSMLTSSVTYGDRSRMEALEGNARSLLGRLYAELIAPVAEALVGVDRLVIVPHGILHQVPFGALHDGERYLIERCEIVLGPSASALAFCRRPLASESHRALVVGHSDHGALPGAIAEAQRVANLFDAECLLEADATRANLRERSREADLIHLATHGHARVDAALFSHVRLEDGPLTALDCFELELDCALVTISACESGLAEIAPGDEPIGLPRALLYAGARSVLQTLWRVDDRTTEHLMDRFYTGLRAGQGRAEALRGAQLDVLHNTSGRSHPFFWAPLVLVGEWGPLWDVRPAERSTHGRESSTADLALPTR